MWQRKEGAGQINPYVQHTDPSDNKLKRSAQSNTFVEVENPIEQVKKRRMRKSATFDNKKNYLLDKKKRHTNAEQDVCK